MTDLTPPAPPHRAFLMTRLDYLLYAGVIFGWSTSWFAMTLQIREAPMEVSVFWRFLLSAPLMFLLAGLQGQQLSYPWKSHFGFLLLGIFIFSSNFICMYTGGLYLPSGLLAVVFSLASVINLAVGVLFFAEKLHKKLLFGGIIGFSGVLAMFEPEIAKASASSSAWTGLALCITGVSFFCVGNQVSAALQRRSIKVLPAAAWGMLYGSLWSGFLSLVQGKSFVVPMTPAYLGSMAFLILSATILAFYTYLSLIGRIGAARAGYATVIFPVFALLISTALEGYVWTPVAVTGLMLALAGNVLVMRRET